MNDGLCDAPFTALALVMAPAAKARLLIADNDLIRLTPSPGSGGG